MLGGLPGELLPATMSGSGPRGAPLRRSTVTVD